MDQGQSGIAASIGIDIGASKANIGILDANEAILAKTKIDIRGFKNDSNATLEAICEESRGVSPSGLPARHSDLPRQARACGRVDPHGDGARPAAVSDWGAQGTASQMIASGTWG